MQNIQSLMETLSGWVWGPYMLVLIVGTGVFLTFRLLFWQFRMLPLAFKQVFGSKKIVFYTVTIPEKKEMKRRIVWIY